MHHVPNLCLNLLSCQSLDNKGYYNGFGDGKRKLTKGSIVVTRGRLSYTLYRTQMMKLLNGDLNAVKDRALPDIWHQQLACINEKGLWILTKKMLIPFTKVMILNTCDHYLLGKQLRVSFNSTSKRKDNNLT